MNIAIIGYGKMGKMIEKAALEAGHKIVAIVDPLLTASGSPASTPSGAPMYLRIAEAKNLNNADVAIEFTRPDTAAANMIAIAQMGIPVIAGSTGWHEKMGDVKNAVAASGTSLLWASNFSLGVNVFFRIAWYAAKMLDQFPEFDVGGFETHHNKKLDSPSGTAKTLVDGVLSRMTRKKKAVYETLLNRQPAADELHYPSLRLGSVPGTHSLLFDAPADTIEITHTARSRENFASGAVRAAQWLTAEKRQGVFSMDDMLMDILGI